MVMDQYAALSKKALDKISFSDIPPVTFHFLVNFLHTTRKVGGIPIPIPNPLDIRFQKVSGLGMSIDTDEIDEGGENFYTQKFPTTVSHDNLVLERGLIQRISPIKSHIIAALNSFKFHTVEVLVLLLNHNNIPIAGWLFRNAFPISWAMSDLDANENDLAIESMEFAYQQLFNISL